jgi:hypothetical protein
LHKIQVRPGPNSSEEFNLKKNSRNQLPPKFCAITPGSATSPKYKHLVNEHNMEQVRLCGITVLLESSEKEGLQQRRSL